ncbi:signal transduction histidine kinase [Anaerotaenia torta]|uniref:sensor histidine kinase n=1 Tax=Anaerotaenia torta TaxID=433293 RepID=UPI003D2192C8
MFLKRKEIKLVAKLDKLLNGEHIEMPAGILEEKVWQVLRSLEAGKQKSNAERESILGLMSDISHQIKTPLSSLMLHLDLAGDPSHTAEEQAAFLDQCKKQAEKINWLTDALFKITRLENGLVAVKKVPSDLVKTVCAAVSSVTAQAEAKGLTITPSLPDTLELAHDPVWTREALCNILDNAIKYTFTGGITVSVEKGPIYTRIDIADTGIGLDPLEYTRIFTRFYRVRCNEARRAEGTGLGLTIAREILRQQGGNITVASEKGKGSVFSVFLQNC